MTPRRVLLEMAEHPQYIFENNYFTELCSGSDAGSYLRLINCVYHSTLGLRVIKKKYLFEVSIGGELVMA